MKKKTKKASKPAGRKHSRTPAMPKLNLPAIKKQLLVMRDDLSKTVRNQQPTDARDTGDEVDEASQSIEKELLFELSDNERVTLDQVDAALRKIDKGTYGLCESCRKPISKARLEALLFARYCITCQTTSESAMPLESAERGEAGFGEESPREKAERES